MSDIRFYGYIAASLAGIAAVIWALAVIWKSETLPK